MEVDYYYWDLAPAWADRIVLDRVTHELFYARDRTWGDQVVQRLEMQGVGTPRLQAKNKGVPGIGPIRYVTLEIRQKIEESFWTHLKTKKLISPENSSMWLTPFGHRVDNVVRLPKPISKETRVIAEKPNDRLF